MESKYCNECPLSTFSFSLCSWPLYTLFSSVAAIANTPVGTRVNTTRETTRQLQKNTKHKQAMDKKERVDNGHLSRYFDSTDPILGISKHDMVSIN